MPEGPEVFLARDFLQKFVGKKIVNAKTLKNSRYGEKDFDLKNLVIKSIKCKGKFMFWGFENCIGERSLA